jgi:hypothetical protein
VNGNQGVQIPVPQLSAQTRVQVMIERADGKIDRLEATGPVQVGPGFLLVTQGQRAIGYALTAIVRWESSESAISLGKAA